MPTGAPTFLWHSSPCEAPQWTHCELSEGPSPPAGRQPRAHRRRDLSGLLLGSRPGRWPTMGSALKQ